MIRNQRFSILGGDMRFSCLANLLRQDGHQVNRCYIGSEHLAESAAFSEHPADLPRADCVIFPMPMESEIGILNTPLYAQPVPIVNILPQVRKGGIAVGGNLTPALETAAKSAGIYLFDYVKQPEFPVFNAVIAAEGALQLAMEELPVTLHGSSCLIAGYGKMGSAIARRLSALGTKVHVAARRAEVLAAAFSDGMIPVRLSEMETVLPSIRLVMNTIPAKVFTRPLLEKLPSDCLLLDLASKPGGIDMNAAADLRIRVIWALSLPGRVAPLSAAEVIKQTIYNLLGRL